MDKALRELTWKRSSGFCEVCGLGLSPFWHWSHRKGKAQGGKYEIANGLATHSECHLETITNYPARAYENGWLIRRNQNPLEVPVLLYGNRWVLLDDLGNYVSTNA